MDKSVLIAHENEAVCTALGTYLAGVYKPVTVSGGEEARRLLTEQPQAFSLAILSVSMHDFDGFAVLFCIRNNPSLRSLAVLLAADAGEDTEQNRAFAVSSGADGFLAEPFDRETLLALTAAAVNHRAMTESVIAPNCDRLTGLPGREAFSFEGTRMIRNHTAGTYILSCIDVECFKVINDQYGARRGDEVLQHIAYSLSVAVEKINGIACRLYADKFAILFPATEQDSDAALQNHAMLMNPPGVSRGIRVRVGRYRVSDTELPFNAMLDRAFLAEASVRGRYDSYIAEYDNIMLERLRTEQRIVGEMEEALQSGAFVPWFQPQYNHKTGALIGAEALVRWEKDSRIIPPCDFIPVFERNGFIYQMDQSVWAQVCAQLRRWIDAGKNPLPISVNVSGYDLLQKDFIPTLRAIMGEYDISTKLLRLEITESAFSEGTEKAISVVRELIDGGFTVEIDDFGSGFSSLNTLKDVPASVLKLDMRFFENAENSERGGNIVESVVRMARWLGMTVVAEGVEEEAQADYLKSIGCDYIQGYYYERPMPVERYEALQEQGSTETKLRGLDTVESFNRTEFWNPKSLETLIFNSYVGGAAIIEYHNGKLDIVRINDRFSQEFGGATLGGTPLAGIAPDECLDAQNLQLLYDCIGQAIESEKESSCEISASKLDAGALYLRCTMRMLAWTDNRYLIFCVIFNITQQRLAEQKERAHNAELLDNLPCGAGLYEFDGKQLTALYLNRAFCSLLGTDSESYKRFSVKDAVHTDDLAQITLELNDAIIQKRDAVCEVRIRGASGQYTRMHVAARIRQKDLHTYSLYTFFMPINDSSLLMVEQKKSKRDKGRLDFIMKNAAISVWSYNRKTGDIVQNDMSRRVHGSEAIVTGVPQSLIESGYVHPDSVDDYLAMYDKIKAGEKEVEGVFRVKTADGEGYWFEHIHYASVSGVDSGDLYFGISTDVTAEYEHDGEIHQWMSLLSEMQVDNNVICEFNLTKDTFIRKQGNLFPAFTSTKSDSFDAYMHAFVRCCVNPEDAGNVLGLLNREKLLAMHAHGVLDGGIDYRAVLDGRDRWCSVSIKFLTYPGDRDVRLIMVHTDIHTRKEDELRLIEENTHDPLTGVLNRKAFERKVGEIIEAQPDATHALFMIDIDNFKLINDSLGHVNGDTVLRKTANGLNGLLRADDLVGRIGGDEFMVFLKNIPSRDVIAKRAAVILDMMHTVIARDVKVSGSLGVGIYPNDGRNFDRLYRCADKAAYYSKQHGKNSFTFYRTDFEHDDAYGDTLSQIDSSCDEAMKAWDERTEQVMQENQRLIERQEEDERYRIVIESTHIVTFEWNALTKKFAVSPEFSQYLLSDQGGEQLFSEYADVSGIHPDDRALFYGRFLEKVLSGESTEETYLRLALRAGGYRWCRLAAIVTFDEAEQLQKAIGIIKEEHVYKRQSDMQLDAIFKYMAAGVLLLEIKQPAIAALYISESYFRMDSAVDLRGGGDDALRFVHPDDYQRLSRKLSICAVSGAVMEEAFRVVHGNEILWRYMHAVRIPYPDASNPVMVAVETDITDLKRKQERLADRQKLTNFALQTAGIASWLYDPDRQRVTPLDARAGERDGACTVAEIPQRFLGGAVSNEDAAALASLYHRIDGGDAGGELLVRVQNSDGAWQTRRIVTAVYRGDGDTPRRVIGISEVSNERK